MGELARLLKQPTPEPAATQTITDGQGNYTQSRVLEKQPTNATELLETFGHDPEALEVVGAFRVAHRELADGRVVSTYSYRLQERAHDAERLAELATQSQAHTPIGSTGKRIFVFQASDLQLGKIDGDGVEGTVKRYWASVDTALRKYQEAQEQSPIATVHLVFAGDCIENGGVSQGGKLAWRQSLTVTEQVRVWRRMLMDTIRKFAPLTDDLQVTVVGGNHDDASRLPVTTRADDNWATEGAIAVSDALEENPAAYGHVQIHVPPIDYGYVTVRIHDTIFTVLHGHQFRRGKAAEWLSSQAFYLGEPTKAHFMLHGHYHSTALHQDGPRTIVCSGTFDGGSAWFRDLTGAESRQGGVVFVAEGAEFEGFTRV